MSTNALNFHIVENKYTDFDSIYDSFVEDYLLNSDLNNEEIRRKYNISHKDFKELADKVKKDYNLLRRPVRLSGRYYYPNHNTFKVCKVVNGKHIHFGTVPTEDIAKKVVQECIKVGWDIEKCFSILENWRSIFIMYDNIFEIIQLNETYLDNLIQKFESEIRDYIKNEWNENLEVYVEYTGVDVEITVIDSELDYKRFEFFIIKLLCEKYSLELHYREVVETPSLNRLQYVEWGLGA